MIKIQRPECPAILQGAARDSDLYRHPDVVSELWNMQHGKCCYCERRIPATGHGKSVEHFAPKGIFKDRRNHWSNLFLACPKCNGTKSNQFPVLLNKNAHENEILYVKEAREDPPALIDPSKLNPELHLAYHIDLDDVFFGQIFPRQGSVLGETTISVTGIGDSFLFKGRRAHVRTLYLAFIALDEANESGVGHLIAAAKDRIEILLSDGSKFAGLAREFARKMKLDSEYGLTIPSIH